MKNKIILPLMLISLFGCNSINQVEIDKAEVKPEAKFDIFQLDQIDKDTHSNNTYVVNVQNEHKGSSFIAKIDINSSDFSVKSASGLERKKTSDIAKIDIYLLQLATVPVAGSDPLTVVNVVANQANIPKTQDSSSFSVLFQNVPANTDSNQYFIGLVLKDSSNNGIVKRPSTPWSGNTATIAPTLAISSSGVTVLPDLTVSTASDLNLSVNLEDAVGATVDGGVYINDGNRSLPSISAN